MNKIQYIIYFILFHLLYRIGNTIDTIHAIPIFLYHLLL